MSYTTQPPRNLADHQYRQELIGKIFSVLKANGSNARGVYYGLDTIPKGGMKALIQQRLFDAVRAEMGGTTVTIEITTERKGEQDQPDALRFATYDFEEFRTWFYNKLKKSGIQPVESAKSSYSVRPTATKLRADLRSAPIFHRQNKKRR